MELAKYSGNYPYSIYNFFHEMAKAEVPLGGIDLSCLGAGDLTFWIKGVLLLS
jgi:hypothetical protein